MPGHLLVIAATLPDANLVEPGVASGSVAPDGTDTFAVTSITDTVHVASHPAIGADLVLALNGPPEALPPAMRAVRRIPQRGNSPGVRLVNIFSEGFGAGYTAVGVISSDTPHLPVAFIQEAFGRLKGDADAALGPADEGGYYLIALREPHPELFADIPWNTGAVLETTLKAAVTAGVKTALLPGWYCVNTASGVGRLRVDLGRHTVDTPATASF
jgi:glycosyltransferase A (GT-A) superfamily protein (DUF2064 family)